MASRCPELNSLPLLPLWQRLTDIVIATALGLLLLPVFIIVSLLIVMLMGRPIFFRQERPGLLARSFAIVKFRTMTVSKYLASDTSPDAARITPLGAFLRRTSLDELPELWNVLRGDMSLVGPRPLLEEYLPYYTPTEQKRFWVRPGLTGLAQISGRNMLDWDSRLGLDARYATELSPGLYFSVLFRTIFKVLSSDGVSVDAYAVAKPLHVERARDPEDSTTSSSP